jgi:hypothetical protein
MAPTISLIRSAWCTKPHASRMHSPAASLAQLDATAGVGVVFIALAGRLDDD